MDLHVAPLLAALVAGPVPTAPTTAPEPTSEPAAPTPVAAPLTSDVLLAAQGERVELTVDGRAELGTLRTVYAETVTLVRDDGQIVSLSRASITALRLAPATAAPPAPVAPTVATCTDDTACEHPNTCIEGACRIDPAYIDALETEGATRRKQGASMMIAGAATIVAGVVILGVGFGVNRTAAGAVEDRCDDPGADREDCDAANLQRSRGMAAGIAGSVIAAIGTVLFVSGGAAHGVGKDKARRAKEHRRSLGFDLSPSRHGLELGLRGRF